MRTSAAHGRPKPSPVRSAGSSATTSYSSKTAPRYARLCTRGRWLCAAPRRASRIAWGKPASLDAAVAAAALILRARMARWSPVSPPISTGSARCWPWPTASVALWITAIRRRCSPMLAVARRAGWVTATFGEVANRADFVLLVGGDPSGTSLASTSDWCATQRRSTEMDRRRWLISGPDVAPPASRLRSRADRGETDLLDSVAALSLLTRERDSDRPFRSSRRCPRRDRRAAAKRAIRRHRLGAFSSRPSEAELVVEHLARPAAASQRPRRAASGCRSAATGTARRHAGDAVAGRLAGAGLLRERRPRHDPWRYDGERCWAPARPMRCVWVAASARAAAGDRGAR